MVSLYLDGNGYGLHTRLSLLSVVNALRLFFPIKDDKE
ncbi:hypothetical protein ECMP0215612_5308 [Escherichia coli MP021561.2]|uniref:Uncharacterized protein n=2 Tax=Klebsiella pneumoniae TaxID=573 RepID=A0A8F7KPY5_KLEPN|nr:hypothetical protein ECMP0215612_5308 [Escherichia coli MP021561.2]QGW59070.1 hypothetical protein pKpnU95_00238 [Klebsiella pneumoniae]QXV89489.1 hypothetical protein [Klebsiella pneumoniae subsp. pneumoniae]QXV89928.1 hypothetical protein [Klebsiella pneumoniae subsp. pneumoniae]QXV90803.1 hypothetical protein [Klebsiella pneumoniae subsp. pneumoniae]